MGKENDEKVVFEKINNFLSPGFTEKEYFKQQETSLSNSLNINCQNMTKSPILLEPSSKMLRITTSKKRKRVVSELVETDLKLPLKENTETKSTRSLDSSSLKNVYDTHSIFKSKDYITKHQQSSKKEKKTQKKSYKQL